MYVYLYESQLVEWGGSDNYVFKFEPAAQQKRTMANGRGPPDPKPRKVSVFMCILFILVHSYSSEPHFCISGKRTIKQKVVSNHHPPTFFMHYQHQHLYTNTDIFVNLANSSNTASAKFRGGEKVSIPFSPHATLLFLSIQNVFTWRIIFRWEI